MKNMPSMKSEYFVHIIIIVLLIIIIAMLLMQSQKKESFGFEHFTDKKGKLNGPCKTTLGIKGGHCDSDLQCKNNICKKK